MRTLLQVMTTARPEHMLQQWQVAVSSQSIGKYNRSFAYDCGLGRSPYSGDRRGERALDGARACVGRLRRLRLAALCATALPRRRAGTDGPELASRFRLPPLRP